MGPAFTMKNQRYLPAQELSGQLALQLIKMGNERDIRFNNHKN